MQNTVPIKKGSPDSAFQLLHVFLTVKCHSVSLIYLDTAYKKMQRKYQLNSLCGNHDLLPLFLHWWRKVIRENVWMLRMSCKDHQASECSFNLPAWRFLCIQHWCGVDMKFMVITDSPWKQDTISDHATIYCLTFGSSHPQLRMFNKRQQWKSWSKLKTFAFNEQAFRWNQA